MSLNLLSIAPRAYLGLAPVQPTALARVQKQPTSLVPFLVLWDTYYAQLAATDIAVSLNASGTFPPLEFIRTVKIDNLGNPLPVYVTFADTTDTIECPAYDCITAVVMTALTNCQVTCPGIGNQNGKNYQTTVYLSNGFIPAQETGSPSPNFYTGSDGKLVPYGAVDKHVSGVVNFANPTILLAAVGGSKQFLTLNAITANLVQFGASAAGLYTFRLYGLSSATSIQDFVFNVPSPQPSLVIGGLCNISGLARPLPLSEGITCAIVSGTPVAGGVISVDLYYSLVNYPP